MPSLKPTWALLALLPFQAHALTPEHEPDVRAEPVDSSGGAAANPCNIHNCCTPFDTIGCPVRSVSGAHCFSPIVSCSISTSPKGRFIRCTCSKGHTFDPNGFF